jgi:CRISPR-associated protein Cas5d
MKSPTYIIKATGPIAIFTRPEFKSERFSYPCITPSAARGLIEAILWKPSIAWHIEKVHILKPIKWTSFRRNEVGSKASAPSKSIIEKGGAAPVLHADRDRVMRNTVALQDVEYAIEAHFTMTSRAGTEENTTKFHEMFTRRMAKGQSFQQPYFGCRECIADLELLEELPTPLTLDKDLGIMLWDIDYQASGKKERNVPIFFHAHIKSGTIDVPPSIEAAQQTLLINTIGLC